MLSEDESVFPSNVIKWVSLAMAGIDPDIQIFRRPLRNSDPAQSIGVFAQMWTPDDESIEMQGLDETAVRQPTLQDYAFGIQAFVKDTSEERGLSTHAALSQRVRSVLYTDANLQLVLGQLSADLPGGEMRESLRRWGVRTARYISGEIDSQMLYLSTLEFWIQTETRRIN